MSLEREKVRESKQEELFFFLWAAVSLLEFSSSPLLDFAIFPFSKETKHPQNTTHARERERNETRERKNIDTRTCSDKTARDSFVDRKRKHTHTTHASE